MKKLLCALLVVAALAGLASDHDGHEERYVREEAARRNMKLITVEEAQRIATERINERGVRFKLDD